MTVMGWIKKISDRSNFLILISEDTLVLYDIIRDELKVKFTVKLEKATKNVQQFLENNENAKIKVVLDPKYISQKFITIPDIGSVKTHQALNEIIKKTDANIVHAITTNKPTTINPEWRFLVVKANLNKNIKKILQLLYDNGVAMSDLHMAILGHMDLALKLTRAFSEELEPQSDHYFYVYIQNANGELCQFLIQNATVMDIKQTSVNENDLTAHIEESFNKNKKAHITNKVPSSKIASIAVLPEQFRSSVSEGRNNFFLSSNEAVIKLTNKHSARTMTHSSVLTEFNFVKNRQRALHLEDQQLSHKLKTKYHIWLGSLIVAIIILVSSTSITIIDSIKLSANIESKSIILDHLKQEFQKLEVTSKEKRALLKNNIKVHELYQIINSNRYSLDTLTKISNANSKKIPIRRFQYYTSDSDPSKYIIELEVSPPEQNQSTSKYFSNVDAFTKNLESGLTDKEICPFRPEKDLHNNKLPITLKLIDSQRDVSDN